MQKPSDNGRTKFNTDVGQFEKTRQQAPAGQDVPQNDRALHNPQAGFRDQQQQQQQGRLGQQNEGAPSPVEQYDTPRDPKTEASRTGHGHMGKSEFGGGEHNAPKKDDPQGTQRSGGVSKK